MQKSLGQIFRFISLKKIKIARLAVGIFSFLILTLIFTNCSSAVPFEPITSSENSAVAMPQNPDAPPQQSISDYNLDFEFLNSDPSGQAMISTWGQGDLSGLNPDGYFDGNSPEKLASNGLSIDSQGQAYTIVAKGVVENNLSLAMQGLKAIRWGFKPSAPCGSGTCLIAGNNGDWPNAQGEGTPSQYTIHNKSVFLEAATRSLHLLKKSRFTNATPMELNSLKVEMDAALQEIGKSARWMSDAPSLQAFFSNAIEKQKQTNQLYFVAVALNEAGIMLDDAALADKGRVRFEQAISLLSSDGVFPEGSKAKDDKEFDASYQTVSLELAARYISSLPTSVYKQTQLDKLQLATNRFLSVVQPDGSFDTSLNARTEACGARTPGPGDAPPTDPNRVITKGKSLDVYSYRLRLLGLLLNQDYKLIAQRIVWYGQDYDHIGCQ